MIREHKKFLALFFAIALIAAFLIAITAKSAEAVTTEDCVPSDAWTEVIEHEAVTHVVHHPEVTETVHHEEVFHYNYQYQKQVRGVVQQRDNGREQWHTTGQSFDWEWWVGGSTQWSTDDVEILQSGPHSAVQETWTQGNHQWRKLTIEYRYVKNGVKEKIVDSEAYDETVVVEEAYDETVIDEEAYTETIEHPAVTCTPEEPEPVVTVASASSYACGDSFETVTTTTTTQGWVLNELTNEWEPGKPIVETSSEQVAHEVVACDVPEEPPVIVKVPVKHTTTVVVKVPTVIDAGL